MGLTDISVERSDITKGTYRWYVWLYNDYWENYLNKIDDADKDDIISVFRKLRDEHIINWNRNYLYELRTCDIDSVKELISEKLKTTDRFSVFKTCLYLSRHLDKNLVLDDHVLMVIPELKEFIDGYTEPELTPLQKRILPLSRSEHSLRDLELLEIRNRGFKKLIAHRALESTGERFHLTNMNSIELNLTYDCNLKCNNCDRMCALAPSKEMMSVDQVAKFIEESKSCERQWIRIGVSGGEPTLHPDILEIMRMLLDYRNVFLSKSSYIQIVSNGYGDANRILKEIESTYRQETIPVTVSNRLVRNNNKRNKIVLHSPVNMAPIDDNDRKSFDFRNGCWVAESAGMCLSMHGYYCCGVGAAIDRVFGYDIGIKSLREVSMGRFLAQRSKLCVLCGRCNDLSISQEYYGPTWVVDEVLSPTWEKAFDSYRRERPSLSTY